MTTLAELLTALTPDAAKTEILGYLSSAGFPVTNWASGGKERTLVETQALLASDLSDLVVAVAAWASLETAEEDALTILARSNFETTRKVATFAVWTLELDDSGNGGPYTIAAGQLWASSPDGRRYNNTTGGTLTLGGTLALTFKAESPGTEYNAGPVTLLTTPLAGVEISDNDLLTSATDEETDAELRARARLQWSTLGTGAMKGAFELRALNADDSIRRVSVRENVPTPGAVLVVVAGTDATASGGAVIAAQNANEDDDVRPLCVTVDTEAAVEHSIAVTATITIESAKQAAAAAALPGLLQTLLRGQRISEADATLDAVYRAALVEVLMAPDGTINAVMTVPAADVALADKEIATLGAVTVTWVTV
jgi:phage-related baseplate assembly protein